MRRNVVPVVFVVLLLAAGAWSSTQTVLWSFSGKNGDGASPYGNSLIADAQGNLYGVTVAGGNSNAGMAFELSPNGSGGYSETVLYDFCSQSTCSDGYAPYGGLVMDQKGNLYGTASLGQGCQSNTGFCGAVYELSPNGAGGWTEAILYGFCNGGDGKQCADGIYPFAGLVMDKQGNLYGTTSQGGYSDAPSYFGPCENIGCGTVFELSPNGQGGWTETSLYLFQGYGDGKASYGGLTLDAKGNLYGTTTQGGATNAGVTFKLSPDGQGGWKETTLHSFGIGKDGVDPEFLTLVRDTAGNFYGTTVYGGSHDTGTVWELSPSKKKKNKYTERVLYNFSGAGGDPFGGVVLSAAGALYGTTESGGPQGRGTLFSLAGAGKKMTEKVLHDFTGGSDGGSPTGNLLQDSKGNLYGMTGIGGTYSLGTVYKITP